MNVVDLTDLDKIRRVEIPLKIGTRVYAPGVGGWVPCRIVTASIQAVPEPVELVDPEYGLIQRERRGTYSNDLRVTYTLAIVGGSQHGQIWAEDVTSESFRTSLPPEELPEINIPPFPEGATNVLQF